MNTIIDLYNKLLVYNNNNISFIIDTDNIIWFKLYDVTNLLGYKSRKDVIRDLVDKKHKKHLKDIQTIHIVDRTKKDTIYITEHFRFKKNLKSTLNKIFKNFI